MEENMDNRTIAAKLDELDTLPAGYAPNLESKWSVLEASLEGKKSGRKTFLVWARIAAILLICLSVTWLFLPRPETKTTVRVKTNEVQPALPLNDQPTPPIVKKSDPVKKTTSRKVKKSLPAEVPVSLPVATLDHAPAADPMNVSPALPESAVIAETPSAKKKKRRYMQVDFGDPVTDPGHGTDMYYAKQLHFQLFGNNEPTEKTSQTNSRTALIRINF